MTNGNLDFLGKAPKYPLSVGEDGDFEVVDGIENIKSSFNFFLSTFTNSLPMTGYGNSAMKLLFEPNDPALLNAYRGELQKELSEYEPRIQVLGVQRVSFPNSPETVRIRIVYKIRNTDVIENEVVDLSS